MSGFPAESASPLAKFTPTSTAPMSPGAAVTAMASASRTVRPACSSASAVTPQMASIWRREAISGTTPPYSLCSSTCVWMTEEQILRPSSMTAAAVSSQLVSILIIFIATPVQVFWGIAPAKDSRRASPPGLFFARAQGNYSPGVFAGRFFPLLVFAKQGHFFCWFCRSNGIFILPFATRQGGFPLPDFSKRQDIFPAAFAGQAGFSFCLFPIGKAVSPSPILANGRTFFPLLLRYF